MLDQLIGQSCVRYVIVYEMKMDKFWIFDRAEMAFAENLGGDTIGFMESPGDTIAIQIRTEKYGNDFFAFQFQTRFRIKILYR